MTGIVIPNNNTSRGVIDDFVQTTKTKLILIKDKALPVIEKIIDVFEKKIWPFIIATSNIVRHTLKTIAIHTPSLAKKLSSTIGKLGTLSAISLVFSIKNSVSDFQTLLSNIKLRDIEGTALSVFSNIARQLNTLDALNTTLTSIEHGFGVAALAPTNAFIKPIMFPVSFYLSGQATVRNTYNIVRLGLEYSHFPKTVDHSKIDNLKQLLNDKFEVTKEEKKTIEKNNKPLNKTKSLDREIKILKDRKRNQLVRRTDLKIVRMMENLKLHLEKKPKDVKTANKALKDIRTITIGKIATGGFTALANGAMFTSLIASTFFGASPLIAPAVSVGRAIVNGGIEIYQNHLMTRWLELPKWAA